MKIENVKIEEIKAYEKNAKKHPEDQIEAIAKSIQEFGFNQPLVLDAHNVIVVGHGRYLAAAKLDLKEVPCIRATDLTPEQIKAYRLADNKLNESGWDMDLAIEELFFLKDEGFDFTLTGFSEDLLIDETKKEELVPEVTESIAKLGDIIEMGEHRLICGDSTDPHVIEALFQGKHAHMTFTDPPYNVDYGGHNNPRWGQKHKAIENDKMSTEEFREFLSKASELIVAFTDGPIYIAMSGKEIGALKDAFEEAGGHWSSYLIWVKSTFNVGRSDYQNQYEPILYGWPERIKNHYFIGSRTISTVWEDIASIKTAFDGQFTSIKFQGFEVRIKGRVEGSVKRRSQRADVWRFDKPTRSKEHPTMKPVALVMEAIKNSSKDGEIVFDPFLGSGTTLIASEMLNRICYGVELDPHYADVIVKRWEEYTGKTAKRSIAQPQNKA